MKILFFKSLPSTQLYLKKLIQNSNDELPIAVVAEIQTEGVGSRDNRWISKEGNLFVSFAVPLNALPTDLKLESASIYFSCIFAETLEAFGSKVFVKWPNDLYINEGKIGGVITNIVGKSLVCGIGLNMNSSDDIFASLDISLDTKSLLAKYFRNIEKRSLWKQVFSKYKLNFQTNQKFTTHIDGKKVLLSETILEDDGSLNINGQKVYSLR